MKINKLLLLGISSLFLLASCGGGTANSSASSGGGFFPGFGTSSAQQQENSSQGGGILPGFSVTQVTEQTQQTQESKQDSVVSWTSPVQESTYSQPVSYGVTGKKFYFGGCYTYINGYYGTDDTCSQVNAVYSGLTLDFRADGYCVYTMTSKSAVMYCSYSQSGSQVTIVAIAGYVGGQYSDLSSQGLSERYSYDSGNNVLVQTQSYNETTYVMQYPYSGPASTDPIAISTVSQYSEPVYSQPTHSEPVSSGVTGKKFTYGGCYTYINGNYGTDDICSQVNAVYSGMSFDFRSDGYCILVSSAATVYCTYSQSSNQVTIYPQVSYAQGQYVDISGQGSATFYYDSANNCLLTTEVYNNTTYVMQYPYSGPASTYVINLSEEARSHISQESASIVGNKYSLTDVVAVDSSGSFSHDSTSQSILSGSTGLYVEFRTDSYVVMGAPSGTAVGTYRTAQNEIAMEFVGMMDANHNVTMMSSSTTLSGIIYNNSVYVSIGQDPSTHIYYYYVLSYSGGASTYTINWNSQPTQTSQGSQGVVLNLSGSYAFYQIAAYSSGITADMVNQITEYMRTANLVINGTNFTLSISGTMYGYAVTSTATGYISVTGYNSEDGSYDIEFHVTKTVSSFAGQVETNTQEAVEYGYTYNDGNIYMYDYETETDFLIFQFKK